MGNYNPDIIIYPYEPFRELLEDKNWTLEQFAQETGTSLQLTKQINFGEVRYDDEKIASLLELVFLVPKSFWINLERNHQEHLTKNK